MNKKKLIKDIEKVLHDLNNIRESNLVEKSYIVESYVEYNCRICNIKHIDDKRYNIEFKIMWHYYNIDFKCSNHEIRGMFVNYMNSLYKNESCIMDFNKIIRTMAEDIDNIIINGGGCCE